MDIRAASATRFVGPGSAAAPDELFLLVQSHLAGEYSIERELGRGGMGVVYLAREVRLAREVALKVLPPALAAAPGMRDQFIREAQMAARLSHPNIVPIHRVDEVGGFVYFVMTYVPGESLAARIRGHGPLPPHQAVQLLRDVAWALTYAHGAGIVHRDVKADNILIERGSGRAIVTDFGIASLASMAPGSTRDGEQLVGSAHYMSPEQIAGEPPDARSDLYSLGVMGYVALSGRFPFDGASPGEIIAKHLRDAAPPLSQVAPTVPPRLAQLIERCLAKRPEYRFESAAAFADALSSAVEPTREIPAPIRVWLAGENRTLGPRIFLTGYIPVSLGLSLGLASQSFLLGAGASLLAVSSIVLLPTLLRTRRVLAQGYGIDDIRIGLREYWVRRREELAYEWTGRDGLSPRLLFTIAGASSAIAVALVAATGLAAAGVATAAGMAASMVAAGAGILGVIRVLRTRWLSVLGQRQTKVWGGKWGDRIVRLASLGLKKRASAQALSQLTEVALGRATDALYEALPNPLRKQLSALPGTVRRLETDATRLRTELERLDSSIVSLDADARAATSSTVSGSARDETLRAERDRLRADLRDTRQRAGDRLAATVAALENIRLDLLRLQLGEGHVESITATLDAARQIAEDLGHQVAAVDETNALLASPRRAGA